MRLLSIRRVMNRIRPKLKENDPDGFLRNISGVIHVGANTGQERKIYRKFGLRVIWIEPIPEVFKILKANLRGFPGQRAMQCLITDRDDEEYRFHIANNKGASSSILDMKHCKKIWPNLNYTDTILLRSTTLVSLFERESINSSNYQALIMDTQGSELLVLKGSIPLLPNFEYVKTEVADFESYAGCCQLADIDSFMTQHGYIEFSLSRLGTRPEGGSYFDIVYKKKAR